ncbi:hypothetical protein [Rappaport israeli]|uniref:hypothetical protein n=1 Tax=Rappaport israeli TaxID=1839807 RepID=UPI0011774CC7|nr:hypothetical protein [Rappaport israeli]
MPTPSTGFCAPYTALSFRSIALTFFLLSNASFLFMLSGHFRLFTLWFALLWIGILATALAAPALLLLNQIHPPNPHPPNASSPYPPSQDFSSSPYITPTNPPSTA